MYAIGTNTMGTLYLQYSSNGYSWSNIWSMSGNKGTAWLSGTVEIPGTTTYIRFRGLTGSNSNTRSDMAIDDVKVISAPTQMPTVVPTQPSPVPTYGPTSQPTVSPLPSPEPSPLPTISLLPSPKPSPGPTNLPSLLPSGLPTLIPSPVPTTTRAPTICVSGQYRHNDTRCYECPPGKISLVSDDSINTKDLVCENCTVGRCK